MLPPLVSIIIPCFNYGRFIEETLKSVRDQTWSNWECIVIDDGSTDNSKEVVRDFCAKDSRFKYRYQKNKGVSAAKNNGLKVANGSYIQFLDADDLLSKAKLKYQLSVFKEKEVDIVYGISYYFLKNDITHLYLHPSKKEVDWMPRISGDGMYVLKRLLSSNIMTICSPLVKRDLIEKAGFFDLSLRYHEDWDYWIRCILSGGRLFYDGDENSASYIRVHEDSYSANTERHLAFRFIVQCKYFVFSKKIDNANYRLVRNGFKIYLKSCMKSLVSFKILKGLMNLLIVLKGFNKIVKGYR